ncbi:hypothetical protein ISG33_09145 [Glaciecola sp. MH2013]|uniref:hypothetical protein n=1 Tax=Glaciecola sp. MH2013 TaxID=2785524 RepID=UPI00189E337A|nr:hypothetical protein [Glaciecola sp. MH2013]MBF7073557.1 hypothetical protein [Glaciecola sp. MH2013]
MLNKTIIVGILTLSLSSLSGCSETESADPEDVALEGSALEGGELALSEAQESAIQALSESDLSLFVILGRQTNIPGASAYQHSNDELEKHCGFKAIAHADVFEGKEEFASLKAKSAYAVAYNKVVLPVCIEKIENGR